MAAQPEHRYCTIFSEGAFCGHPAGAHDCCKGCYSKLDSAVKGRYAMYHEKNKDVIAAH